jgi:hypothetical protein
MSGGLEIVNPISPLLEKISREERTGREFPRRMQDGKSSRHRDHRDADETEEAEDTMSSNHIDLRI